jgi:integrase
MKVRKYPKGVSEFVDRHGTLRIRGRRAGQPTYYFKCRPPGTAFEEELRNWLADEIKAPPIGVSRDRPGTISALVARYYRSAEFWKLEKSTQTTYRGILERFREQHGHRTVAGLDKLAVRKLVEAKRETPWAANNFLKLLRVLMRFAVEEGMRRDDPTVGVRPIASKTTGHHSWTEAEIAQFEKAHAVGSRARLAFALLLYTGQRRSDVIHMGPQHVKNGCISVRQQKTGAALEIPIHSELGRIIAATPSEHLSFLVTNERGKSKSFTAPGFTNWFREMCRDAGLPHCSAHGLRKALARRLAEAGCSEHEIAAITGHRSLQEVRRYTQAASQLVLARRAMEAIPSSKIEQELANPGEAVSQKRAK